MLQWNSKITALLVLVALLTIAATNGTGIWLNFTW
jgi:hypothetical protein